jgi:hypothetical protein
METSRTSSKNMTAEEWASHLDLERDDAREALRALIKTLAVAAEDSSVREVHSRAA